MNKTLITTFLTAAGLLVSAGTLNAALTQAPPFLRFQDSLLIPRNDYKLPNPIPSVTNAIPVATYLHTKGIDASAIETMGAICMAEVSVPGCGNLTKDVKGCATWSWRDGKVPRLHYRTYNDVSGGIRVEPIAPPGGETLPLELHMSHWGLSEYDRSVLSAAHPTLVDIAEQEIEVVREHEEGHWAVMQQAFEDYLDVINNFSGFTTPYTLGDPTDFLNTIDNIFVNNWAGALQRERQLHDGFHAQTHPVEADLLAPVALDEFEDIFCSSAEEFTHNVFVSTGEKDSFDNHDDHLVVTGPRGLDCKSSNDPFNPRGTCGIRLLRNTPVTLTANTSPEQAENYTFKEWYGQDNAGNNICPCHGSSESTCSFTTQPDTKTYVCRARFENVRKNVSATPYLGIESGLGDAPTINYVKQAASVTGTGGLSCMAPGSQASENKCEQRFALDETVSLNAQVTPEGLGAGIKFERWENGVLGSCACHNSTSPTCTFTVKQDNDCRAIFTAPANVVLLDPYTEPYDEEPLPEDSPAPSPTPVPDIGDLIIFQ